MSLTMRRQLARERIVCLGLMICGIVGCDPGYRYRPIGWTKSSSGLWKYENKDFQLELWPPGNLAGAASVIWEASVHNRTDHDLVFEGATLIVDGRRYEGKFPGEGQPVHRSIRPHETKRVHVLFNLDGPLYDAVGDSMESILRYRVGALQEETLVVRLERK